MRKFIVVKIPYSRYGQDGPEELELYEAKDLDDLVGILELLLAPTPKNLKEWGDNPADCQSPAEWLAEAEDDGMAAYCIKELLPNGTLSERLI